MKTVQTTDVEKKHLQIGNVKINSIVALAPMAGITDIVFRQIIRMLSPTCLLTTEMLSSEALKWNGEKSIAFSNDFEKPVAFQIAGHKPDLMAEAAKKLQDRATMIDINMGCPAPKITKNGDGSALMNDVVLASNIIRAVKNSVAIPVTVKFRLGWSSDSQNYIEFAKMAQESGADAITVHGRTKNQMYSGIANWNAIAEIKESVNIPVIGNGDIDSVEKAIECLNISKCDGIAIGRGSLGNPELIFRIEHYINTGEILPEYPLNKKIDLLKFHLNREIEHRREEVGMKFMRKFFGWYIKGFEGASQYREKLVRMNDYAGIIQLLDEITMKDIQEMISHE